MSVSSSFYMTLSNKDWAAPSMLGIVVPQEPARHSSIHMICDLITCFSSPMNNLTLDQSCDALLEVTEKGDATMCVAPEVNLHNKHGRHVETAVIIRGQICRISPRGS